MTLGHPIGASSIPVGTRLSPGKSSVVIPLWSRWQPELSHTPESVASVAAFWRERLPLLGQHKRQKRLVGGADMHCLPAVSSAEQRYIKAPVSRCLLSYQNHHGSFPRRLSIASPSTFFVRLSLRWKWSAAPISGCSIPSVNP